MGVRWRSTLTSAVASGGRGVSRAEASMNTVPTGDGPLPPPVPPDPCKAPDCVNAKAELQTARQAFTRSCEGLRRVNGIIRFLALFTNVPGWTLVVLVIVAVVLWFLGLGWLSVILWSLVLLYLVALILSLVLASVAATLGAELAQHAAEVQQALAKVIARCPESCRGDLTVPVCET